MWPSESTISAVLATGLISLAPNLILFLFPNFGKADPESDSKRGDVILSIGQAIAAGGLLGDVFLHTLPHTILMDESGFEDQEDLALSVGKAILGGFIMFLVLDGLIKIIRDKDECGGIEKKNESNVVSKPLSNMMTSKVILNLAADALHNFTDGLAIGASYSISSNSSTTSTSVLNDQGTLASLSILLHEIPHELGDYSILLSSGFTKNQAIMTQFITAIAAFLGTFTGLFLSQIYELLNLTKSVDKEHNQDHSNRLLLSFTAGGFIYLAACGIIPDLLEHKASMKARSLQLFAFCCGIGFMYLVAVLEHDYGIGGHEHHHDHHHEHHHDHHHDHHHNHEL